MIDDNNSAFALKRPARFYDLCGMNFVALLPFEA
jgi:hypothetical protein